MRGLLFRAVDAPSMDPVRSNIIANLLLNFPVLRFKDRRDIPRRSQKAAPVGWHLWDRWREVLYRSKDGGLGNDEAEGPRKPSGSGPSSSGDHTQAMASSPRDEPAALSRRMGHCRPGPRISSKLIYCHNSRRLPATRSGRQNRGLFRSRPVEAHDEIDRTVRRREPVGHLVATW